MRLKRRGFWVRGADDEYARRMSVRRVYGRGRRSVVLLAWGVAHGVQTLESDVDAHFKLSHPRDLGTLTWQSSGRCTVQEHLLSGRDRAAMRQADRGAELS
jgi:hypothetical protein